MSWAGLRGAVPIVLATIPLAEAIDGATQLFDIVFVIVVIYTLLTAPSLPLVAKVLKVARRSEPRDLEVEAAPLERIAADLLQVTISPKSLMHGVEVGELRLPPGSSVALIVRDGKTLVPERRTVLRRGDDVLVVTATQGPRGHRAAAAGGLGRRAARPVAGPQAALPDQSTSMQVSTGAGRRTRLAALRSRPLNWLPTRTSMPGPRSVADDLHLGAAAQGEGHQPGRVVVGLGRPHDRPAHRGAARGVAGVAAAEAGLLELLQRAAGQALLGPALKTLTWTSPRVTNACTCFSVGAARRVRRSAAGQRGGRGLEAVDGHAAQHERAARGG